MIPQEEYQKEIDRQRSVKHNANKKARKEIARRLTKENGKSTSELNNEARN